MDILNFTLDNFERFLFVFVRVLGILTVAPIFGHRSIVSQVKVGIALMVAVALFPVVPPTLAPHPHLILLVLAIIKELLMGMLIGFVSLLVFIAVKFSGELIGLEVGFGIVNVLDPLSSDQVSLIGEFQNLLATLIFLGINGHHLILRGLAASFDMVPLGGAHLTGLLGQNLIDTTGRVFVLAVQLAAPVMATLFLTTLALGIVARTIPQMNVFIVGFPVKIIVGMAMLMFTLPMFYAALVKMFAGTERDISTILRLMSGK